MKKSFLHSLEAVTICNLNRQRSAPITQNLKWTRGLTVMSCLLTVTQDRKCMYDVRAITVALEKHYVLHNFGVCLSVRR